MELSLEAQVQQRIQSQNARQEQIAAAYTPGRELTRHEKRDVRRLMKGASSNAVFVPFVMPTEESLQLEVDIKPPSPPKRPREDPVQEPPPKRTKPTPKAASKKPTNPPSPISNAEDEAPAKPASKQISDKAKGKRKLVEESQSEDDQPPPKKAPAPAPQKRAFARKSTGGPPPKKKKPVSEEPPPPKPVPAKKPPTKKAPPPPSPSPSPEPVKEKPPVKAKPKPKAAAKPKPPSKPTSSKAKEPKKPKEPIVSKKQAEVRASKNRKTAQKTEKPNLFMAILESLKTVIQNKQNEGDLPEEALNFMETYLETAESHFEEISETAEKLAVTKPSANSAAPHDSAKLQAKIDELDQKIKKEDDKIDAQIAQYSVYQSQQQRISELHTVATSAGLAAQRWCEPPPDYELGSLDLECLLSGLGTRLKAKGMGVRDVEKKVIGFVDTL